MSTPIRLSRSIVGQAEADAVSRVILEDGYLGMGSEVKRFEADIAAFLGVPATHVVTVNTGTAALHLAVEAAVEPGAEVLVQSLTFVASFQAISAARAIPVACEVRPDTCTIDLEDAARRLTDKTAAIMPVHYASNPAFLDDVYAFAHKHGLRVIEDAAHAFGCRHNGKLVGTFGDIACFSFDGIKNITSGEGGCIVTADQTVAQRCRDARLLSVQNDTEMRFSGQRSWDFDVTRQGWRFHMSNIMAAIGRVQLARLPGEFGPARKALAAIYRQRLTNAPNITLLDVRPEDDIIAHIFPVRIAAHKRDAVKAHLAALGIPTGVHYKPNHLLSLYGGGNQKLPITEHLYEELVTLPMHPGITTDELNAICDALLAALV